MALATLPQENNKEKVEKKLISFRRMSFYLDLKDYPNLNGLIVDINGLGGTVETFLSKDVKYVVTNRSNPNISPSFDCESSSSRPSSRSRTSLNVLQDSSSNVEQKRLKLNETVKSRAVILLQNARKTNTLKGSCDALQVANMWGVKVIHVTMLTKCIKKLKSRNANEKLLNEAKKENNTEECGKKRIYGKCQRIKLVRPYIKYEDDKKKYMPQHRQLRDWPVLNFESETNRTPFTKIVCGNETNKEVNLMNQKTTTSKFTKVEVGKKPGYCEMCSLNYDNIYKHVDTEKHKTYVSDKKNFALLDMRISLLPDLDEFVDSLFRAKAEPSYESNETPVISVESQLLSTSEIILDTSSVTKSMKRKINSEFSLPPKKRSASILKHLFMTEDENKISTNVSNCKSPSKHFSGLRKPLESLTNDSNLSLRNSCFESPITMQKPPPIATRLLRSTAKRRCSSQSSAKDSSSPRNAKSPSKTVVGGSPAFETPLIVTTETLNLTKETDKENKSPVKAITSTMSSFSEEQRVDVKMRSKCGVSRVNDSSFSEKSFKMRQTPSKGVKSARRALSYSPNSSLIEESVAVDGTVAIQVASNGVSSKTPQEQGFLLIQTLHTTEKTSKANYLSVRQRKVSSSFAVAENEAIGSDNRQPLHEQDSLLILTTDTDVKTSITKCPIVERQEVSGSCTVSGDEAKNVAQSGDQKETPRKRGNLVIQTPNVLKQVASYSCTKVLDRSVAENVTKNVAQSDDMNKQPHERDFTLIHTSDTEVKSPVMKQKKVSISFSVVENEAIGGVKSNSALKRTPNLKAIVSDSRTKVVNRTVANNVSQSGDTSEQPHEQDVLPIQTSDSDAKTSKAKSPMMKQQKVFSSRTVSNYVVTCGDSKRSSHEQVTSLIQTSDSDSKSWKAKSPMMKQQKVSISCAQVVDRTVNRNRRMLRRLGVPRSSTYDNEPSTDRNAASFTVRDPSRAERHQECLSELQELNITVFKNPSQPRKVIVSDNSIGDLRSSLNSGSPKNLSIDETILISDETSSDYDRLDGEDSAYVDYVTSLEINDDKIDWHLVSDVSRTSESSDNRSFLTKSVADRKVPLTKLKLKRFKNDFDSDWSYKVIDGDFQL